MTRFLSVVVVGLIAAPAFGQTKEIQKEIGQMLGDLRADEDAEVMRRLLGRAVFPTAGPSRFTFDALPLPGYGVAFTLKLGTLAPDPGPPAAAAEAAETCKKCHESDAAKVLKGFAAPATGPAAPGAKDEWQQALAEVRNGAAGDKPAAVKPTPPAVCYPGRVAEAVVRTLVKHGRNVRLEKGEDRLTAVVSGDQGWPPSQLVNPAGRYRVTYQPQTRYATTKANGQSYVTQSTYYVPVYEPTDDPAGTLGADLFQPVGITPPPLPDLPLTVPSDGVTDVNIGPEKLAPGVPQPPPSRPSTPGEARDLPSLPNIPSPGVPIAQGASSNPTSPLPATPPQPGFTADEAAQLRLGELHLRQNNPSAAVQAFNRALARYPDGKVKSATAKEPVAEAYRKLAQALLASGDLAAAKKAIDVAANVAVTAGGEKPGPVAAKLVISVKRSDLEAAVVNPAELRKRMTVELRKGRPVPAEEAMPTVTPPPTVPSRDA